MPARIRYALLSTALAAVFLALFGNPRRLPGEWLGFLGLLGVVFLISLVLYGKVD
jgi:hypothetical protein